MEQVEKLDPRDQDELSEMITQCAYLENQKQALNSFVMNRIQRNYKLSDGDQVDKDTGVITRVRNLSLAGKDGQDKVSER